MIKGVKLLKGSPGSKVALVTMKHSLEKKKNFSHAAVGTNDSQASVDQFASVSPTFDPD